ncbi:ribosomal protein S5 domain 2-type protein [Pisolithus marmoratus]|nr:ribosomal protein S5 domain 2-type protein [Pisolithus marmoratus]
MHHPVSEIQEAMANLLADPGTEQVASEMMVLQSIYGDNTIQPWKSPANGKPGNELATTIRYVVSVKSSRILSSLPAHEDVSIRVLLQLLSRYIGAFGVDSSLFGSILRTFISTSAVQWSPGTVCVFDGLQNVLERCENWYQERLHKDKAGEDAHTDTLPIDPPLCEQEEEALPVDPPGNAVLPEGIQVIAVEPIVDRKSVFVGRACRISHPSQVPLILDHLMSDRQIARATHPVIHAWRCKVGNVLHQDNDDDGETAAGSRLAHLLSILEIDAVLVVVTRWFGGIQLGPDRFKHINHAARNALEAAGFLDHVEDSGKVGKTLQKGRRR